MYTYNLTNVIKDPTRITNKSSTLIDYAITTNPARVTKSGSFDTCISDHNLIFANFFRKQKLPKLITVRNYKNMNMINLQHDLENSLCQLIDLFDDPNDSLWCWETVFKSTLFEHVKPRKVKVCSDNQPWMTGTLRKSLNNRFKLFKKVKSSTNDPEKWKQ